MEQMDWLPGFTIDGAHAAAAMKVGRELAGGESRGLLVDMRTLGVIDKEARSIFATPNDWAYAVALWVRSPLSMVVANFFLGVSRSPVPVRMFTKETDAVTWLQAQRP